MADSEISISSISTQKLENVAQKAQVAVFKKALSQEAEIGAKLIESATSTLPDGKGGRVNVAA